MPGSKKSDPKTYTKPELRDRIKEEVIKGDKGGNPGQWSARKAQLVTQEYEREGGGYKEAPNETQNSLKQWGEEHWTTADHERARRPGGTTRYLPEKAWTELTPAEKKSTNRKKQEGSREGKQFVSNTQKASSARKSASASSAKKSVKKSVKKSGSKRQGR